MFVAVLTGLFCWEREPKWFGTNYYEININDLFGADDGIDGRLHDGKA